MGSGKVWDYASDTYVHRLVQSNIDNKIIEVGARNVDEDYRSSFEEKLDAITMEYTCIVAKELNEQRKYFEGVVESIKDSHEREVIIY